MLKTYDAGASTHGTFGTVAQAIKRRVKMFFDREGELIRLRNAVGMMAEARRSDSVEYHDMAEALRKARVTIRELQDARK